MPLTELQIKGEKPAKKPKRLSDAHGLYLLLNPKRIARSRCAAV